MGSDRDDRIEAVSRRISGYIREDLDWDGTEEQLLGAEPVALPEVLDSTQLLDLAGFLEDEYAITLADDEVVPENFATARVLAGVVVAKQETPAP